jgi:hypothetical protein
MDGLWRSQSSINPVTLSMENVNLYALTLALALINKKTFCLNKSLRPSLVLYLPELLDHSVSCVRRKKLIA